MLIKNSRMFEAKEIVPLNNDWITVVFFTILVLLVVLKVLYKERLFHISTLFLSKKYLLIYFNKEKAKSTQVFYILLFLVRLLVVSLILFLASNYISVLKESLTLKSFTSIFVVLAVYFGLRYVIGVFLAFIFDLKNEHTKILYDKVSYFNTLILWVLPLLLISAYSYNHREILLKVTFAFFIFLLIVRYTLILINNKNLIFNHLFYFILYLCALEIAPLIIILKLSI